MAESNLALPALKERIRDHLLDMGWEPPDIDQFVEAELPDMVRRRAGLGDEPNGGPPAFRQGGLPRLPADVAWPMCPDGFGLTYIGALDCAVLPRDHLAAALPESGQVLFFFGHDDETERGIVVPGEFAVMYVPDTAETTERTPPEGEYVPDVAERLDLYANPTFEIGFDEFYSGLPYERYRRLDGLSERLDHESKRFLDGVGGYPSNQQIAPEWVMAHDEHERTGGDIEEHEDLARREWMVLLKLFESPTEFGEYLNYMVRRDDLAAGRFDRVILATDIND